MNYLTQRFLKFYFIPLRMIELHSTVLHGCENKVVDTRGPGSHGPPDNLNDQEKSHTFEKLSPSSFC